MGDRCVRATRTRQELAGTVLDVRDLCHVQSSTDGVQGGDVGVDTELDG